MVEEPEEDRGQRHRFRFRVMLMRVGVGVGVGVVVGGWLEVGMGESVRLDLPMWRRAAASTARAGGVGVCCLAGVRLEALLVDIVPLTWVVWVA